MARTDPIAITLTRIQWTRIYYKITRSDDPTPTANALAAAISARLGQDGPLTDPDRRDTLQ